MVWRMATLVRPAVCACAGGPRRTQEVGIREIPIALVDGVLSAIAFHEKAGRSQVDSFVFSLDKILFQPSRCCRHPSIRTLMSDHFARCKLGVLVSAGAAAT
jgi:hypothetical protein